LALALALSGVIIWTVGGQHRFFFIPMHYWGPVLIALSILPFIVR
jgi:hypothetical protein